MNYERIAARFQQRLAETVAKYEADIILMQEQYEEKIAELENSKETSDVVSTEEG